MHIETRLQCMCGYRMQAGYDNGKGHMIEGSGIFCQFVWECEEIICSSKTSEYNRVTRGEKWGLKRGGRRKWL